MTHSNEASSRQDHSAEHDLPIYGGHHVKETICDVLASVVGSAASVYSGQPFDTVKVRLQVSTSNQYSGILQCFRNTIKGEGVLALWKGSLPAFMGAISENVVAFAVNGLLRRVFHTEEEDKSVLEPFLCGGVTGIFSAVALCPCDVVKCRTQVNIAKGIHQEGSISLVRSILRTRGPSGLYVGLGAQITRDIPFYATFFGSYELLCRYMKKHTDLPETSIYFISGG